MGKRDRETYLHYLNTISDEDLIAYCKARQYDKKPITYRELFLKLDEEKKKLVKALALYMDSFVGKIKVNSLPIIEKYHFDKLLSFNYTSTYEDLYSDDIETCYIHGKPGGDLTNNNMVLGFDDHYIDGNKVSINIGTMNCGNTINIVRITTDLNMNVYIKAKERKTPLTAQCLCNPSLNIYFTRKVKSVTLVSEDGMKLGECRY